MKEPIYNGKMVVIAWGHDLDMEEQEARVNKFLGTEWDWDQVHDWVYGDGDPGFGIMPKISADDPRVLKLVEEFGKLMEMDELSDHYDEIDEHIAIVYQNEDVVVLFVNE